MFIRFSHGDAFSDVFISFKKKFHSMDDGFKSLTSIALVIKDLSRMDLSLFSSMVFMKHLSKIL